MPADGVVSSLRWPAEMTGDGTCLMILFVLVPVTVLRGSREGMFDFELLETVVFITGGKVSGSREVLRDVFN